MRTVAGPSLRPRRGPVILATAAVAAVGILGVGGFTTYRQLVLAPPADCQLAQRLIDTGADLSPNYPAHAEQWVRVLHQEATRIGDSSLRERITGYLNLAEPL